MLGTSLKMYELESITGCIIHVSVHPGFQLQQKQTKAWAPSHIFIFIRMNFIPLGSEKKNPNSEKPFYCCRRGEYCIWGFRHKVIAVQYWNIISIVLQNIYIGFKDYWKVFQFKYFWTLMKSSVCLCNSVLRQCHEDIPMTSCLKLNEQNAFRPIIPPSSIRRAS